MCENTLLFDDEHAWLRWPQYRHWYDKLWLSDRLGYKCGPGCVNIPEPGYYIVRPVINLYGLGAGTEILYLENGYTVPPGYFWCEVFSGEHVTQDLEWISDRRVWSPIRTMIGEKVSCTRFVRWYREDRNIDIPVWFDEIKNVGHINIEAIGGKIIEVHLRLNPDTDYKQIIPVHHGSSLECPGDNFIWLPTDDDGSFTPDRRLGFWAQV